jgi:hypothetical protein
MTGAQRIGSMAKIITAVAVMQLWGAAAGWGCPA